MSGRPLELLWGMMLKAPGYLPTAAGDKQFAGRTTLASGDATVTASTTVVQADDIVRISVSAATDAASGALGATVEVRSISAGNFITFSTPDGVAANRSTTVMWELVRTSTP
jgi:hypothetical protein